MFNQEVGSDSSQQLHHAVRLPVIIQDMDELLTGYSFPFGRLSDSTLTLQQSLKSKEISSPRGYAYCALTLQAISDFGHIAVMQMQLSQQICAMMLSSIAQI